MAKHTYRNHLIEEDSDFENARLFYVYPEGADDYGMDPIGEFSSMASAKQAVDEMIRAVEEYHATSDF